jgi:hypothetical protein
VVQPRLRIGLGADAVQEVRILKQVLGQDLERYGAVQYRVPGQEDRAHAAFAEQADNLVVAEHAPRSREFGGREHGRLATALTQALVEPDGHSVFFGLVGFHGHALARVASVASV